jgi:hypothetical protein
VRSKASSKSQLASLEERLVIFECLIESKTKSTNCKVGRSAICIAVVLQLKYDDIARIRSSGEML